MEFRSLNHSFHAVNGNLLKSVRIFKTQKKHIKLYIQLMAIYFTSFERYFKYFNPSYLQSSNKN